VKTTKPRIIALLIAVVIVATAALYLAIFLSNRYSGRAPLNQLLSAGIDLFQKKQYKDAALKLQECYQKAPEGDLKSRALLFLARCYREQPQREQALELWARVAENPTMQMHRAEAFYSIAALRDRGEAPEDQKAAEEYLQKAAQATPASRFSDLAQIEIASRMLDRGNLRPAQDILEKLRVQKKDYPELRKTQFKLNMKLLFSPILTEIPKTENYVVKEGDTLSGPRGIANTFGTTVDLLEQSNNVDPRRLQIGKRLKVVTGKFRLKVSKTKNILQLISGDIVLNEYRIGTGEYGSTPAGKFVIADKVKEPPWFREGRVIPYGHPDNVLGTRWMKLKSTDGQDELTGYGIHGTDDESSIGRESSQGCIRLLNRDVEELFQIVPIGTEVTIEE
jgi:lipoprotein-anchoring transpeptidase ErfK/SrfK